MGLGAQAALMVVALLPVVLSPGASAVLVVRHAAGGGRRGAASVIAGTVTGFYVHATLAAVGLSALVMASATAFGVVRLIGAVYLIALGVTLLVRPDRSSAARPEPRARRPYRQALAANIFNPKAAGVYLTLPAQFAVGDVAATVFVFATVHGVLCLIWLSALTRAAGMVRRHRRLRDAGIWFRRAGALLLIGMGVRTAVGS